jgi:hypothetical protein
MGRPQIFTCIAAHMDICREFLLIFDWHIFVPYRDIPHQADFFGRMQP